MFNKSNSLKTKLSNQMLFWVVFVVVVVGLILLFAFSNNWRALADTQYCTEDGSGGVFTNALGWASHATPFCCAGSITLCISVSSCSGSDCYLHNFSCMGDTPVSAEDPISSCGNGICGNNSVEPPEQCDDGNTTDGDGCSSACTNEGGGGCGDCANDSDCVDMGMGDPSSSCYLGFGGSSLLMVECVVSTGECVLGECDRNEDCGMYVDGVGWAPGLCDFRQRPFPDIESERSEGLYGICAPDAPCCMGKEAGYEEFCFGFIEPDQCSEAHLPGSFDYLCQWICPVCGNDILEPPYEQCDDGNTTNGDGCSSTCQIEGGDICCVPNPDCGGLACDGLSIEDCENSKCISGTIPGGDCVRSCAYSSGECKPSAGAGDHCKALSDSACEADPYCKPDPDADCGSPNCEGCGDGEVNDPKEECDDGNNVSGDGCSYNCKIETGGMCGDGIVTPPEECDDNNNIDGDGCAADCTYEECRFCGDGTVDSDIGEQCEGSGSCESVCVGDKEGWIEYCGDKPSGTCSGVHCEVDGASCIPTFDEDGMDNFCQGIPSCTGTIFCKLAGAGATCNPDSCMCEPPVTECGNGTVDPGEECDDGNHNSGDGCSYNCKIETGGMCVIGDGIINTPDENCDGDGDCASVGGCVANPEKNWQDWCQWLSGLLGGGCAAIGPECQLEGGLCVPGPVLDDPEERQSACDLAGSLSEMRCRDAYHAGDAGPDDGGCKWVEEGGGGICNPDSCMCEIPPAECGDGIVTPPEECDDNNNIDGDGCSATCQIEGGMCVIGDGIINTPDENCDGDGDCGGICVSSPLEWQDFCHMEPIDDCTSFYCKVDGTECVPAFDDEGMEDYCSIRKIEPRCWNIFCKWADKSTCDPDTCMCELPEPECGDHVIDPPEQCDDGNRTDGDGCDKNCKDETGKKVCGDGEVNQPEEECDEGTADTATCDRDCTLVACGDNHVNTVAGEQCDDGNTNNNDGCSASCQWESATGCIPLRANQNETADVINIVYVAFNYSSPADLVPKATQWMNALLSVDPFIAENQKLQFWVADTMPPATPGAGGGCWDKCGGGSRGAYSSYCPTLPNRIHTVGCNYTCRSAAWTNGGPIYMESDEPRILYVSTHEFGHALGGLADEYVEPIKGDQWRAPNCANNNAQANTWWGSRIGTGDVGMFEGCSYVMDNRRPKANGLMNGDTSLPYPFTTDYGDISVERLIERLAPYSGNPLLTFLTRSLFVFKPFEFIFKLL
ncbi:MAG: DUF4215 domain-containing protein [Patescibacteria group bacterium]